MTQPDDKRFPHGNPTHEYIRLRGLNKPDDIHNADSASMHDLLCAILMSADAIWDELRRIRMMMEKDRGVGE